MEVKLLLFMNFAAIINCQSTISHRNDAAYECELTLDIKFEIESIRQQLLNIEQEKKMDIEEIRQIVNQEYWSRNQQRKTGMIRLNTLLS